MDSSVLDTAPFALNGQPTIKPDYFQQRLGATLGGPLVVPHVVNSPRTFFFVNYTGNHSRNPYDAYSTVPTLAERGGDLSAIAGAVVDPLTGQPFANNQIPASRINPTSQKLLNSVSGSQPGRHAELPLGSNDDQCAGRHQRPVRAHVRRGSAARGAWWRRRGGGGGGRGGPGAGRAGVSNLNVSIHYRHSDNSSLNPLPSLGGTSNISAWDIPVNYSFTKLGMTHSLRFDFNQQRAQTTNLLRQQRERGGQCRRARRVLRSIRLGRAEPVVQQHRQRPRHQSGVAHRSHHRDRRHDHENLRQADSALRRRLQEHSG